MHSSELLLRWTNQSTVRVVDDQGLTEHDVLLSASRALSANLLGATQASHLRGERIGLFAEPGARFVAALYAIMAAGGVGVVLSPLYPKEETDYFLRDAGVKRVLADTQNAHRVPGALLIDALSKPLPHGHVTLPELNADDPALQLYTSGTTSRPKGAVLSHGNLSTQQRLVANAWEFGPQDTLLHSLPLHHMHGLCIAMLTALGRGACVRFQKFHSESLWESMRDATVFMAVPTMYAKLLAAFDQASPETQQRWREHARALRLATSGSAALPVSLAERWAVLTGEIPLERFGMTEIGVGIANRYSPKASKPGGHTRDRVAGTVGFPLPSVELRIVDEQGVDADSGALWIRGPSVFLGYHQRPEATEAAFRDGWFVTGDIAERDPEGRIRILGRASVDILKTGGYKVSALEIEEALRRYHGIRDASVLGLPDDVWGDRIVACLESSTLDVQSFTEHLRAFLGECLAPYKIPKEFHIFESLPRNKARTTESK
jgi:malonyl-CoA/methylmalonyl-CoA synthetase